MRKTLVLLCLWLFCTPWTIAGGEPEPYSKWLSGFNALKPGISRSVAEKVIEQERGVKSTYDLYAMDTDDIVVYKLDDKYILIVCYKPGTPGERGIEGHGGHAPEDGKYLRHKVTYLR